MIAVSDSKTALGPMALECEMCVIGALLMCGDRDDLFTETRAQLSRNSFVQEDHAIIFATLCEMRDEGRKIDATLLMEELSHRQLLEAVGGYEYIGQLLSAVPSAGHGPEYARKVADASAWRELIRICDRARERAYRPYKFEAAVQAAMELADAATKLVTTGAPDTIVPLAEPVATVLARRTSPQIRRIPTGIKTLDNVIGGLPRGKFTIVAADPRVGKSQLLKQIGKNMASRGVRFGLVSIEEDREKVAENLLANQSGIDNYKIAFGKLSNDEWDTLEESGADLKPMPFFIEDSIDCIEDICIAIQRLVFKHKCEVVAVDHVHLITSGGENREQEISRISRALKMEFKKLGVPGIAAAQLNRGAQAKEKPILKNLRGSGSLEADADVVLLLWREDLAKQYEDSYTPNYKLTTIVAKNKDGEMGEVELHVSGATQTVGDLPPNSITGMSDEELAGFGL